MPLVSQGMDKLQQKQRWKYVLEKFSHTAAAVSGRRNPIPPEIEAQLLEMPELKRGRFIEEPSKQKQRPEEDSSRIGEGAENGLGSAGKEMGSSAFNGLIEATKMYRSLSNLNGDAGKGETRNNSCSPDAAARNLLDIEPTVSVGVAGGRGVGCGCGVWWVWLLCIVGVTDNGVSSGCGGFNGQSSGPDG